MFRYQKILQGTSFDILATAVSRSPSVLGTIDADKAERVVKLSGVASSNADPKVLYFLGKDIVYSSWLEEKLT